MKSLTEILKPALTLTIICLIISLALAGTNVLTADAIAQNNEKEAYETRIKVLEGADDFETVAIEPFTTEDGSQFVEMVRATNGTGYVATTTTKGYGGEMTVMTGFDNDGNIVGVSVLSSSETPGLGKKAEEPDFTEQYLGKSGPLSVVKNTAGSDSDIVAISGATISSKAVTAAVNCASQGFAEMN